MASFKEDIEDMGGDETTSTWCGVLVHVELALRGRVTCEKNLCHDCGLQLIVLVEIW
jgi:hypothetical protein